MKLLRNLTIGVAVLIALFAYGHAQSASTYDTYSIPPTRLKDRINSTQTTGIRLLPPKRNGVAISWPALSGGIIHLEGNGVEEDIYYSHATVDADLVVTLTGTVIRDLCWNMLTFVGCGDGQRFNPGATAIFSNNHRLYNFSARKDRPNTFSESGAIKFSDSGSFQPPYFANSTERDAQRPSPGPFEVACLTDTGACYQFIGNEWRIMESGSGVVNATDSIAGIVERGTTTDIINGTITGESGANPVVPTSLVTRSSTGTTQANKIPALGSNGLLSGSLLAENYDSTTANASYFLTGNQRLALPPTSFYFGTCADGDVEIATGSTITLNADAHYDNLTIWSGAILKPNGYRVFVCGTLLMRDGNGRFTGIFAEGGNGWNGGNASGTTPGVGGSGGLLAHGTGTLVGTEAGADGGAGGAGKGTGCGGGNGTAGNPGKSSTGTTVGIGSTANSAAGGAGGLGTGGTGCNNAAGAGGAPGSSGSTTISNARMLYNALLTMLSWENARNYTGGSPAGGGGGGGGGESGESGPSGAGGGGGGSGAPGGNADVYAATLSGSGTISVKGGNGGNGGNGSADGGGANPAGDGGGGGPGGGGPGGTLNLATRTKLNWTGTLRYSGGTAGTVGTGAGTASNGSAAPNGPSGHLFEFTVR